MRGGSGRERRREAVSVEVLMESVKKEEKNIIYYLPDVI
jgi:hypothetical protein